MSSCSVIGCGNTNRNVKKLNENREKPIRFHRFPKDLEMKQKWMEACGLRELKERSVICSVHFEESCYGDKPLQQIYLNYSPVRQRKFKVDAVPTLNLPKSTASRTSIFEGSKNSFVLKRESGSYVDADTDGISDSRNYKTGALNLDTNDIYLDAEDLDVESIEVEVQTSSTSLDVTSFKKIEEEHSYFSSDYATVMEKLFPDVKKEKSCGSGAEECNNNFDIEDEPVSSNETVDNLMEVEESNIEAEPIKPSDSRTTQIEPIRPSDSGISQIKPIRPSDSGTSQIKHIRPSDSRTSQLKPIRPSDSGTIQIKPIRPSDSRTSQFKPIRPSDSRTSQIEPIRYTVEISKNMESFRSQENKAANSAFTGEQKSALDALKNIRNLIKEKNVLGDPDLLIRLDVEIDRLEVKEAEWRAKQDYEEVERFLMTEKIKNLQSRIAKMDKEIIVLKNKNQEYQKILDRFFSKSMMNKLLGKKCSGWSAEDIADAITLKSISPKAYSFLQEKGWPLPGLSTLRRWNQKLHS